MILNLGNQIEISTDTSIEDEAFFVINSSKVKTISNIDDQNHLQSMINNSN